MMIIAPVTPTIIPNQPVRRCALVALALLLWLVAGQVRAVERTEIHDFLKVTGFDVAVRSIAGSVADAPAMLGLSEEDFGPGWQSAVADLFAEAELQGLALDMLETTLSEEMRVHAMEFYGSALGRRLITVENAAHMAPDDPGAEAEGARLYAEAGDARRALLERMAAGVDVSGVAVDAAQDFQVRFLMAASAAGLLEGELDEAALRAQLGQGRAALAETLRQSGIHGAAYTYRDFTDDELLTYVEALETPLMARVYELLNAVQYEIMANRFERLALRMGDLRAGQEL